MPATSDLLDWAHREFSLPWQRQCRVAHRLSLGAELSPEEARVRVLFTPHEIDYAAVYPLLGHAMRTILFQPARLATVVHDGSGRVVRAYHEDTREGHYVALKPLDLPEVVPLDGPALLALANAAAERQGLPKVDWVKVADLRFFETFREAGQDWGRLFVAARTCVENGWIRFHPMPPAFRALFRWMERLRGVDPAHLRLDRLAPATPRTPVVLRGPDYTCLFDPWPKRASHLNRLPFEKLASRFDRALVLRVDPLLRLARAWLERDTWDLYETPRRLAEAGRFLKGLGDLWDLRPRPSIAYTLARLFFVPLDTDYLLGAGARHFLRAVVAEKGESRFAVVVEEEGAVLAALELAFRDGAFVEARTRPPDQEFNAESAETAGKKSRGASASSALSSGTHSPKNIELTRPFGYNSALPVLVVHAGALREGARQAARLGEASWRERWRIFRTLLGLRTVTAHPATLGRLLPRGRLSWLWRLLRLPFDRK